jgi:hypothetical protein
MPPKKIKRPIAWSLLFSELFEKSNLLEFEKRTIRKLVFSGFSSRGDQFSQFGTPPDKGK